VHICSCPRGPAARRQAPRACGAQLRLVPRLRCAEMGGGQSPRARPTAATTGRSPSPGLPSPGFRERNRQKFKSRWEKNSMPRVIFCIFLIAFLGVSWHGQFKNTKKKSAFFFFEIPGPKSTHPPTWAFLRGFFAPPAARIKIA
jgi:hypothetical protein